MDEVKPKVHPERLESGALKREAKLLSAMVHDYCRRHHGGESLCEDCKTFLTYALTRLACCPFGQKKTYMSEMHNSLLSSSRKRNGTRYHA